MKVADYIACRLAKETTDAFGIPGGVILDLIYAFENSGKLKPHLCFHEQDAGFAACGYAQASGKLGVAYSTKGPGFTNLITPIAEAFYEFIPSLFITAHSSSTFRGDRNVGSAQELNTCDIIKSITKFAVSVDDIYELQPILDKAIKIAKEAPCGPVFLDFNQSIFSKEIELQNIAPFPKDNEEDNFAYSEIINLINSHQKPVILLGDGINQAGAQDKIRQLIKKTGIPAISSRASHDIFNDPEYYFGYVGSHGVRFANYILSESDQIISIGNRMDFPSGSESFSPVLHKNIIYINLTPPRFRQNKNHVHVKEDLNKVLEKFLKLEFNIKSFQPWRDRCKDIYNEFLETDVDNEIKDIASFLKQQNQEDLIICDVGNNEFMVSRAMIYGNLPNTTIYSKTFGALGCSLGKAIGAYYASGKRIIVFIGDQGLQMNIQAMQYISFHKLPVTIFLINNSCSAMIKDREEIKGYDTNLHVSINDGYSQPDFKSISIAYGIDYFNFTNYPTKFKPDQPVFIEFKIDYKRLSPWLEKGRSLKDMSPEPYTFS